MGGYGSGRSRHRQIVEHCRALDVNWMKKRGWFDFQGTYRYDWYMNKKPYGSIHVHIREDEVVLSYRQQDASENWHDCRETIALEKVSCRLGGYRFWFKCPRCRQRCQKVYLLDGCACRACWCLAYRSENESASDRLRNRLWKLETRIGKSGIRPKGMHERTFQRFWHQYQTLQIALEKQFCRELNAVYQRLSKSVW